MSIACWIVVFTPQIWENYQLKSGDGLSVTFIVLWLLGDLFNGFGGVMAHVLPTMVILAVYVSVVYSVRCTVTDARCVVLVLRFPAPCSSLLLSIPAAAAGLHRA